MLNELIRTAKKSNNIKIFFAIFLLLIGFFPGCYSKIYLLYASLNNDYEFKITSSQLNGADLKSDCKTLTTTHLFDYFAYTDLSFNNFPSREYVTAIFPEDSETPVLMAVEIPWYKYNKADKACDAAYEFIDNGDEDALKTIAFKGSVRPMTEDEYSLYTEAYAETGYEMLPYVLCDDKMSYLKYDGTISDNNSPIMLIGSLLFFIFGAIVFVSSVKANSEMKDLNNIKSKFEQTYGVDSFDAAIKECEFGRNIADKVYVGKHWLAFATNKPIILNLNDVIWIYKEIQRYNFIKVSTNIIIRTVDNKTHNISVKDRGEYETLIDLIDKSYAIVFGYNMKLLHAYNKGQLKTAVLEKRLNKQQ